jgi:hypothetical protein
LLMFLLFCCWRLQTQNHLILSLRWLTASTIDKLKMKCDENKSWKVPSQRTNLKLETLNFFLVFSLRPEQGSDDRFRTRTNQLG